VYHTVQKIQGGVGAIRATNRNCKAVSRADFVLNFKRDAPLEEHETVSESEANFIAFASQKDLTPVLRMSFLIKPK